MKFKAGQIVRMRESCSECKKGNSYKLVKDKYGQLWASINGKTALGCYCEHNWILISKSNNMSKKKVNFIIQYMLDEDPVEEFETMAQVDKRIKELSEDSSLERDSIFIYEVKERYSVTLETTVVKKKI